MIGLNSGAGVENNGYAALDFAFFCHPGSAMYIYENGDHIMTDYTGWNDNDWHELRMEAGKVEYWLR